MPFKSCGPGIEFQMFETYLCDSISNKNIYLGPMTFRLLQSCEIPPHWYEGARILVIMRACRPRISRPHCSTAAPSPVLLQSPQISCSAPSSVWHTWYLANSAVILQWIDSVPSAQYAMPCNVSKLSPRPFSRLWPGAVAAVARLLTASNQFASLAGSRTGTSLTPASGQWSLVLQKVPSEANMKVRNHGEGPY